MPSSFGLCKLGRRSFKIVVQASYAAIFQHGKACGIQPAEGSAKTRADSGGKLFHNSDKALKITSFKPAPTGHKSDMPIRACGQFQDFLFKSRGIQQSMAWRIAAASLSAELAIHRAIAALDINNRAQFNDIAKICPAQSVRFLKKLPVGNGREPKCFDSANQG